MGDLISRSDTMKRLRNYAEQKHYNGEVELANGILKAICFIEYEENIPTAYDVEKVVAELEKREEACKECYVEEMMTGSGGSASKYCGERRAYNNAIKIAKRGGVE